MTQYMSTIKELAKFLVEVLKTDRDAVVVITGDTGEGKSVFNWLLQKEISTITKVPFNPVKTLVYSKDEFNTRIDDLPEYGGLSADEAVGLFYSRDFHDDEQIALLKKMDRIRYRHLVTTFLIPSLFHIDAHIRNARVRIWIYVDSRKGMGKDGYAHAYIFKKHKNPFNADPWNVKENEKLFNRGKIDKSPNYMGEVLFYDMDPREARIYKGIKDTKRLIAEMSEWKKAKIKKRRGDKYDPQVVTA